MSNYDDAVAYLNTEVHQRCDYDIYSTMRDIVDEMEIENDKLIVKLNAEHIARQNVEAENAKLRELVRDMHADVVRLKDELTTFDHKPTQDECVVGMLVLGILGSINDRMRELGVEVQS